MSSDRGALRLGPTSFVAAVGLASAALYAVTELAQRGLFRNGLELEVAGVTRAWDPRDGGALAVQLTVYAAATIALLGLYALLLRRVRRDGLTGRALRLAVAIPILFNVALLFVRPFASIDLFTYMAWGAIGALPDGNPYVTGTGAVAPTELGGDLAEYGWRPVADVAPYGPVWIHVLTGVMEATQDVYTALVLLKLVVVAASLGTAWLIWTTLGRVRPEWQLLGTLAYLWNPVIVVELAAEGHNEAPAAFFALAAVALAVRTRVAASLGSLLLAALTKFVPLILLPAHLVYLWRRMGARTLARRTALAAALGAAATAALYGFLWAGTQTFEGLRIMRELGVVPSLAGSFGAAASPYVSGADAAEAAAFALGLGFAAYVVLQSLRARDAETFLRACGRIALAYVLVASAVYWPWYVTLPLALLVLVPAAEVLVLVVAVSLGARLAAPLDVLGVNEWIAWPEQIFAATLLCVVLLLVFFLAVASRGWRTSGAGVALLRRREAA